MPSPVPALSHSRCRCSLTVNERRCRGEGGVWLLSLQSHSGSPLWENWPEWEGALRSSCSAPGPRPVSSIPTGPQPAAAGRRRGQSRGLPLSLLRGGWSFRGQSPLLHPHHVYATQSGRGVSCLPLAMGKRHRPAVFLTWAWKMFRRRFIFAAGLLPDTDCIFWENARPGLMTERAEEQGWASSARPLPGRAGTRRAGALGGSELITE